MKKHLKIQVNSLVVAAIAVVTLAVPFAYAQTTTDSEITQSITDGVISTSIRDAGGNVVVSPSFAMSSVAASTSQQTSTGTFGSNTQRITVDNPNGSVTGGAWTLALNATDPGVSQWTSGSDTYAYNGATAAAGQLTVNPASGVLTAVTGGSTGVTLGTLATFSGSTPITLATASSSAAAIWNGYITGIGLSQTIPPAQPVGSYTLDMTQTVTAQ